jgi:hypothetical protein
VRGRLSEEVEESDMKFSAVVEQILDMLQRQGRVSYRLLRREFELDDDLLADFKEELLYSRAQEVREEGPGLVCVGTPAVESVQLVVRSPQPLASSTQALAPKPQLPSAYTPSHLAERIRAVPVTEGERKTITALFADLKGSTALVEGLDPEEARSVIDPALQLMMDAVHQYDGFVAQALDDGIFALFGAPIAHEDHPQRAVYAALRMQEAMRRSAPAEAMTLLTEAVTLVQRLPSTPEHLQQELPLQTTLGAILITTKGYGTLETERTYTRAYALCQQLGETTQLFLVLWGLQQRTGDGVRGLSFCRQN